MKARKRAQGSDLRTGPRGHRHRHGTTRPRQDHGAADARRSPRPADRKRDEQRFLRSALTEENPYHSTDQALAWIEGRAKMNQLIAEPVPFSELAEWSFQEPSGDLAHRSGKFFRVEGIRVSTNQGPLAE